MPDSLNGRLLMDSTKGAGSRMKKFLGSRREEIIEKQFHEIKSLESKYQRLYDDSPVMCRTINTDGIILDCNQAYLDHLRYSSKSEVVGHSIFEHTPEDKIYLKRESFEQWRATGSVRNKEVWLKRKDGSEFPAVINASNLYDKSGDLVGSNTVITDLTQIYEAKQQLENANKETKELESRYRKLYDDAPDMYRTENTDGIILDCNKAYVHDLGYLTKDEMIGHSIFEHTADHSLESMRESFEQWRTTGTVRNKEIFLKRKNGSTFPVLISANNLYDDFGKLIGSITSIIDETDIYKARREIEKAHEMEQDFLRIAAHELRTPIQPILMCAEAAKAGLVNQNEAWDIVIADAKRLKKLADDILDVSRIESGNFPYDLQKVSINEIINEVLSSSRRFEVHQSQTEGPRTVSIKTELDQDITMPVDKGRMIQALLNLITNSLKFTKEGQITVGTRILAKKKLLEIKVSDTGMGISPEILPRLFEKFVTKTSGDAANKHGTGLGLFITRSIIQAHGGEIFAYNNKENGDGSLGATFVMRLPIQDDIVK